MKLSKQKQPKKTKNLKKFQHLRTQQQVAIVTRYRGGTHHEINLDDDEELSIVLGILALIVGVWWGIVHLIDMWFNKLTWWQEPLTIIPFLVVGIPSMMLIELYGKNPMHWWPVFWGTKVTIPERQPFRAYDEKFETVLEKFGPTRVYVENYTTLKFRTKKDAVIFSLTNFE